MYRRPVVLWGIGNTSTVRALKVVELSSMSVLFLKSTQVTIALTPTLIFSLVPQTRDHIPRLSSVKLR
jgi:hypothetical protein